MANYMCYRARLSSKPETLLERSAQAGCRRQGLEAEPCIWAGPLAVEAFHMNGYRSRSRLLKSSRLRDRCWWPTRSRAECRA